MKIQSHAIMVKESKNGAASFVTKWLRIIIQKKKRRGKWSVELHCTVLQLAHQSNCMSLKSIYRRRTGVRLEDQTQRIDVRSDRLRFDIDLTRFTDRTCGFRIQGGAVAVHLTYSLPQRLSSTVTTRAHKATWQVLCTVSAAFAAIGLLSRSVRQRPPFVILILRDGNSSNVLLIELWSVSIEFISFQAAVMNLSRRAAMHFKGAKCCCLFYQVLHICLYAVTYHAFKHQHYNCTRQASSVCLFVVVSIAR